MPQQRITTISTSDNAAAAQVLFQGKWRVKVIERLLIGPTRLSELKRSIPNCSKKVLLDTLRGLQELGWIIREEHETKLKRVDYSLATGWEQKIRGLVAILAVDQLPTDVSLPESDEPLETPPG